MPSQGLLPVKGKWSVHSLTSSRVYFYTLTILHMCNISDSYNSHSSTRGEKNIVLAQESRILPTKLDHLSESDTSVKITKPPTAGLRGKYSLTRMELFRLPHTVPLHQSECTLKHRKVRSRWEGENSLQSVLCESMIMNQISNEAVIGMMTK